MNHIRIGLLLIVSFLSACATVAYRADYVPNGAVDAKPTIEGTILIYTSKEDDERIIEDNARSFSRSAVRLTMPVGTMAREVGLKVFSRLATRGANVSNDLSEASRYARIIRPQIQNFRYGFKTAKNLGVAETPYVQLELRLSILDQTGRALFEKSYSSGVVEGRTFFVAAHPYGRISQLAHTTLYTLLLKAAEDVRAFDQTAGESSAPAEGHARAIRSCRRRASMNLRASL